MGVMEGHLPQESGSSCPQSTCSCTVFVDWTQQAGCRASCSELASEASALVTWGSICLPN